MYDFTVVHEVVCDFRVRYEKYKSKFFSEKLSIFPYVLGKVSIFRTLIVVINGIGSAQRCLAVLYLPAALTCTQARRGKARQLCGDRFVKGEDLVTSLRHIPSGGTRRRGGPGRCMQRIAEKRPVWRAVPGIDHGPGLYLPH